RVGAPRHLAGQRELPALRPEPQAGQPARRPALRGDDGRPEAPSREPAGHKAGDRLLSAPEDLLERIRLRLEASFVGTGEAGAKGGASCPSSPPPCGPRWSACSSTPTTPRAGS